MSGFFSEEENERQGRTRRAAKTQQLYSARPQAAPAPAPYAKDKFLVEAGPEGQYVANMDTEFTPNDPSASRGKFAPNDEAVVPIASPAWANNEDDYLPNEPAARPSVFAAGGAVMPGGSYLENEESAYSEYDKELPSPSAAYYRRPVEARGLDDEELPLEEEAAFAPPPKFSMPGLPLVEVEKPAQDFSHANVYQPKAATWSETERRESLTLRQAAYRVEAEQEARSLKQQHKKRGLKGLGIAVCVLIVLGAAGYLSRDWIGEQIKRLSGEESATVAGQADLAADPRKAKGYDAAPAAKLNEKTQKNIAAVSGTMEMETYAVTGSHVVTRVKTGENQYDVYLFSGKDGTLLGYYEGVSETGFVPQPNESFYVEQPPYLLGRDGKPLLSTSMYEQYVGKNPVLSPFENGWAIISDTEGEEFNYINQEGQLLSTLWFARALPFYGDYTAAYVDTGNLAKPEARYALYILSADGKMERWQYAADMDGLMGAAGNLALLSSGELVSLKDTAKTICMTDLAVAYLDCEAMVVRDQETGKFGLFVKGEQHYDFAYDSIEPVPCEIQWKRVEDRGFTFCAVANATYPQPLSHYFTLQRDGAEELVALSTRSVCPIILK